MVKEIQKVLDLSVLLIVNLLKKQLNLLWDQKLKIQMKKIQV